MPIISIPCCFGPICRSESPPKLPSAQKIGEMCPHRPSSGVRRRHLEAPGPTRAAYTRLKRGSRLVVRVSSTGPGTRPQRAARATWRPSSDNTRVKDPLGVLAGVPMEHPPTAHSRDGYVRSHRLCRCRQGAERQRPEERAHICPDVARRPGRSFAWRYQYRTCLLPCWRT
ncbi:uncharacterized protein LY79DRAFT_288174 [Colletotrichum navitas]|uniref:Uncharacterized protein n=1 Tax=Colletotrichum navitas TaxID=681940 RepID=A0AAD8QB19_9PEZI|nr:uncharacterized protein LY79DRAFT_288174 [Colletotrichum navitas]KAK1598422.1 hypothetical protein LY79DRAFT_288174 [Colletotrichum navitas]